MTIGQGAGYAFVQAPTLKRLDMGLASNPEVAAFCREGVVVDSTTNSYVGGIKNGKRTPAPTKREKGESMTDYIVRAHSTCKAWGRYLAQINEDLDRGVQHVVYQA